jgi:adenylate cyclase
VSVSAAPVLWFVAVLSLEELSRRTGEPVEHLADWQRLGMIGTAGADGFGPLDVERVRLVRLFLQRGIPLEKIVPWAKSDRMERYLELVDPAPPGPVWPQADAAALAGLTPEFVRQISEAAGLADGGDLVTEEDLQLFRRLRTVLDAGFPEQALIQFARVVADALGRIAETEARLFRFYIYERLRASGLSPAELDDATRRASALAGPITEPAILYLRKRAAAHALREDFVMELAELAGLDALGDLPGELVAAVVFTDLAGFSSLAEAMGDLKAAEVLDRFSGLVREVVSMAQGRIVKQIGDAFLLIYAEPRTALTCALEIERRAAVIPQFPALRTGIHWGRVLYRDGDYVGANVNLAARVVDAAERHQVLVTVEVRRAVADLDGVEFERLGLRRVKGLAEPIELYAARAAGGAPRARLFDPVCRMELGEAEVAARLALEGSERVFCSEACLRKFVAAPERYTGAGPGSAP